MSRFFAQRTKNKNNYEGSLMLSRAMPGIGKIRKIDIEHKQVQANIGAQSVKDAAAKEAVCKNSAGGDSETVIVFLQVVPDDPADRDARLRALVENKAAAEKIFGITINAALAVDVTNRVNEQTALFQLFFTVIAGKSAYNTLLPSVQNAIKKYCQSNLGNLDKFVRALKNVAIKLMLETVKNSEPDIESQLLYLRKMVSCLPQSKDEDLKSIAESKALTSIVAIPVLQTLTNKVNENLRLVIYGRILKMFLQQNDLNKLVTFLALLNSADQLHFAAINKILPTYPMVLGLSELRGFEESLYVASLLRKRISELEQIKAKQESEDNKEDESSPKLDAASKAKIISDIIILGIFKPKQSEPASAALPSPDRDIATTICNYLSR